MTQNKSLGDSAPAISVVMPVFNNEKYMEETIKYVLNQTFKDFEYIIINDGSTDETGDICQKYAQLDNRIKYVYRENGGIAKAINQGIDLAKGSYLLILDSDDIFDPEMFEKMHAKAVANNADVTMCNWVMLFEDGREGSPILNPDEFPGTDVFTAVDIAKSSNRNVYTTTTTFYSNKLYRMDFINSNNIRFIEDSLASSVSDGIFVPMTISLAKNISIIYDVFIKYRVIEHKKKISNQVYSILQMPVELKRQLQAHNIFEKFKGELLDYMINGNLIARFEYYEYDDLKDTFEKLPEVYKELEIGVEDVETLDLKVYKNSFSSGKFEMNDYVEEFKRKLDDLQMHVGNQEAIIKNLQAHIGYLESFIENQEAIIKSKENEIADIHSSSIWKVGRIVTYVPRKFKH